MIILFYIGAQNNISLDRLSHFDIRKMIILALILFGLINRCMANEAAETKGNFKQDCKKFIKDTDFNATMKTGGQKYDAMMDMFFILLNERKTCKCIERYAVKLQQEKSKLSGEDKVSYDGIKACKRLKKTINLGNEHLLNVRTMGGNYEAVMDMFTILLEDRQACGCLKKVILRLKQDIQQLSKGSKNCRQLFLRGKTSNGIYEISPDMKTSFNVYCDMTNGGWTVIQRRNNSAVSFDRTWKEYADGFGDPSADHWLGLTHIHQLTTSTSGPDEIFFDLDVNGKSATAIYGGFGVDNADSKFKLHLNSTVTFNTVLTNCVKNNAFYYHNGMKFTTKDSDNDKYKINCGTQYQNAGWWYRSCYNVNLNMGFSSMVFSGCKVSKSEIKIR